MCSINSNLTPTSATGSNLNNLNGNIRIYGNNLTNSPNLSGVFIVNQIQMDANNKWQIAVGMNLNGAVYTRICRNGTWQNWGTIAFV